jgi:DNA replicative helicase MCM subunit Mcm2 (Cdc46/Mcm family)
MSRNTITATPRQLESLIRLSEALAKMEFNENVHVDHVREAIRLMQVATKKAAMDPVTGNFQIFFKYLFNYLHIRLDRYGHLEHRKNLDTTSYDK